MTKRSAKSYDVDECNFSDIAGGDNENEDRRNGSERRKFAYLRGANRRSGKNRRRRNNS